ncbi:hypothetical protein NE237_020854 [Protea cynaroides]|uniref:DUF4283 domain-containing protein n=1 Tax=Protea cynaroides TaxID=273540 RepID=A0A9Q0H803_9MAGN|nr:hypothetical protein NE237_020854 [Protea cynaroides]
MEQGTNIPDFNPTSPINPANNKPATDDLDHIHVGDTEEPFLLEDDSYSYNEENLGSKPFRRQAVTEALPTAWNTVHGVEVILVDKMTYLFRFKHSLDLLNVLKEAPWTVAGNLTILEGWSRKLLRLLKSEKPEILFLIETKNKHEKLEQLKKKFKFHHLFTVDPIGFSGGLALFWKDNISLNIISYN